MRSCRQVVLDVALLTLILSAIMIGFLSAAYGSDSGINPTFEKVDIQRVDDDDEALNRYPQMKDLRSIEEWKGALPTYMTLGSVTPFVSFK